jgi:hypothetical protein
MSQQSTNILWGIFMINAGTLVLLFNRRIAEKRIEYQKSLGLGCTGPKMLAFQRAAGITMGLALTVWGILTILGRGFRPSAS